MEPFFFFLFLLFCAFVGKLILLNVLSPSARWTCCTRHHSRPCHPASFKPRSPCCLYQVARHKHRIPKVPMVMVMVRVSFVPLWCCLFCLFLFSLCVSEDFVLQHSPADDRQQQQQQQPSPLDWSSQPSSQPSTSSLQEWQNSISEEPEPFEDLQVLDPRHNHSCIPRLNVKQ